MSDSLRAYTSSTDGLNRLYDAIGGALPGVQQEMIRLVLWDAVEEFCVQTTLWRAALPWEIAPDEDRVDLNAMNPLARVAWVFGVRGLTYRLIPPATLLDIGTDHLDYRSGEAEVALAPRQLDAVPSSIVDDWNEALRDGALWRLYAQPGKPYSSMPVSAVYMRRWRAALNRGRIAARQQGPGTPRFPYFAGGRNGLIGGWGSFGRGPGAGVSPVTNPGTSLSVLGVTAPVFLPTPLGDLSYATITLINKGRAPIAISDISFSGAFALVGSELIIGA